jgi:hypothetical protein
MPGNGGAFVTTDTRPADQVEQTLRDQLTEAVRTGQHAEARRLREDLLALDLRRKGREIGVMLPPPPDHTIDRVADMLGYLTEGPDQ